jgi:transposase InsO family protein
MDEKKREEIALFRYRLIIPFLAPDELEWGVKGELLKRLVKQNYSIPFSNKSSLSAATLRRYLAAYRKKGFDGLKPKSRSDVGASNKIPPDILDKAFELKKEEPRRSARKIVRLMEAHQLAAPGLLKPSTLSRLLRKNNLTTQQLKKTKKSFRAFQAEHPNQIWQSDVMYGPYLPHPDQPETKKRTYLVAVLDDYSRLIPHAEFYWHEKLPHLENTLQKAILKRGIPHVLYVDNGQIYSAHQINIICAELGIRKITSKPYSPEGRGKIERFFRTVRADFLAELQHEKVDHLHQLNSKFWAWLEQAYHQHLHSTTKETPTTRWRHHVTPYLRKIDEKQLQSIFLWRKNRTVSKTGLVSYDGLKYEVSTCPAGTTVELRYDPFHNETVFIYLDGQFIQKAHPTSLPRWNTSKKQPEKTTAAEKKPDTHIHHLQHLEKQHQQHKAQHAKSLLGQTPPQYHKTSFTLAHLIKDIATVLDRTVESLHAHEIQDIEHAWTTYGPWQQPLVHIAMAKAILKKRKDQHISFYLQEIITTHQNHHNTSHNHNAKE